MFENASSLIDYKYLPGHIHRYRFLQNTNEVIDAWLAHVRHCYSVTPREGMLRTVVIIDGGTPPVNYSFQRTYELVQQHPDRPHARTAVVMPQNFFFTILLRMMAALPYDRDLVRGFACDDYRAALRWVRSA